MALPDPAGSRAVLVGVEDYGPLDPLPGVVAGARRLAGLLCDPRVWGLPPGNVTVLDAQPSADDILKAVRDAGQATTDTLLVYFAGHGLRQREGAELYLAMADADDNNLPIGTLPYRALLDVAKRRAPHARCRITLLDCCYSGLAIGMGGSAAALERPDPAQPLSDVYSGPGSWIMTSASGTQRSFTSPGEYPYFTGALIEVLENGIRGAGPTLSLDRISKEVIERCEEQKRQGRKVPRPQCDNRNFVGDEPWVRNRAHGARPAAPVRRVLPAKPEPVPSPADPSDELRFTTVKGGGYRIGEARERMKSVIAKVENPRLGWQAVPPHFRTVSLRWTWGWDMKEVDAHIEQWRAEPKEFVDALRLLLARQGITVVPDGGPLVGRLTARFAKDAVTFTETHLCLKSPDARMSVPYSELEHVRRATSTERVDTGVVNDQGVYPSEGTVFITHVTYGHRTLEFREGYPTPVLDALRAFQPAMSDLRERHPEWFRMVP